MEIVGLSGYARSGKDEAAKVLVEEFGFTRVAFADKLREVLYVAGGAIDEFEVAGDDPDHDVAHDAAEADHRVDLVGVRLVLRLAVRTLDLEEHVDAARERVLLVEGLPAGVEHQEEVVHPGATLDRHAALLQLADVGVRDVVRDLRARARPRDLRDAGPVPRLLPPDRPGVALRAGRGVRRGGEPVGRVVAALTARAAPAGGPSGVFGLEARRVSAFCGPSRRARG